MGPSSLQQDSNDILALNNMHLKHLKSISSSHKWSSGMLCLNIKTSIMGIKKRWTQPGQLLIELPKRKTFYHRSHTSIIDDGEGSKMQTQSPDDSLSVDKSC